MGLCFVSEDAADRPLNACIPARSSFQECYNLLNLKELRFSWRFFLIEYPFKVLWQQVKSVEKPDLLGFVRLFSMFWLYRLARYNVGPVGDCPGMVGQTWPEKASEWIP